MERIYRYINAHKIFFLLSIAYAIWVYCFRHFISGEQGLVSDAQAYYQHTVYFVDQLSRGIIPLWDPTRQVGVPNELFLRRIGEFNPVYLILLFFVKAGVPAGAVYYKFLPFYYLLGVTGFYLFLDKIFKRKEIAFTGCLLLLFSSLGTRAFDSYLILTFTPMAWFSFFLVSFARFPQRRDFLGMTFTLMILCTTYLPFYFLIIFLTFFICFAVIFPIRFRGQNVSLLKFFGFHKIFTVLCLAALLLSLVPGILFFAKAQEGQFVLPERQVGSNMENSIEVDFERVSRWGTEEDVLYALAYSNLKQFKFAVFYIPIFLIALLGMSLFLPVSRRMLFLVLWGALLFLINSHHAPIYGFLYEKIFFLKYFRNLHFFLWLGILPILIILAAECFRAILKQKEDGGVQRMTVVVVAVVWHVLMLFALIKQGDAVFPSYLSVVLSLIFFMLYLTRGLSLERWSGLVFILVLIVLQPVNVYHYLDKNFVKGTREYGYGEGYMKFSLPDKESRNALVARQKDFKKQGVSSVPYTKAGQIHYGTKGYKTLCAYFNYTIVREYLERGKLLVYDRVQEVREEDFNIQRAEESFLTNENLAYVSGDGSPRTIQLSDQFDEFAEIVTDRSPNVQVRSFGANSLEIETRYTVPKFLVYNDSYNTEWMASINGKKVEVLRANVAFKGVYLPVGKNVVRFVFSSPAAYGLKLSLMIICNFIFITLLLLCWQSRENTPRLISGEDRM